MMEKRRGGKDRDIRGQKVTFIYYTSATARGKASSDGEVESVGRNYEPVRGKSKEKWEILSRRYSWVA